MSVDTYGWDLVYAMRFPSVNRVMKVNHGLESKAVKDFKNNLAHKVADNYSHGIMARVRRSGTGYTKLPTIRVMDWENDRPTTATDAIISPRFSVDKIIILNQGSGYTGNPTVKITTAQGVSRTAMAAAKLGVASITITAPGKVYTTPPTVSFTGGVGSGAEAHAILGTDGKVIKVEVTKSGSYSVAPTVNFSPNPLPKLKATANLGLVVEVTDPGHGYKDIPTITLEGGGATVAATAYAEMRLDGVNMDQAGTGYMSAPLLEVVNDPGDTTGNGTYVASSLTFTYPAKTSLFPSSRLNIKHFIKKHIEDFLQVNYKDEPQYQEIVKHANNEIDIHNGQDSETVAAYFGEIFKGIYKNAIWPRTFKRADLTQEILQKGAHDTGKKEYYQEALYLANSLADKYGVPKEDGFNTINGVLNKIEVEELAKIENNIIKEFQSMNDLTIYDLNKIPNDPDFELKMGNLTINNDNRVPFFNLMINGMAGALRRRHHDYINALGYRPADTSFKLKQIKLQTGPWQLVTGGDGPICRMKIPITAGYLNLGTKSKVFHGTDNYILLELNLNWVRSVSKAHLVIPKEKSVKVIDIKANTTPALSDDDKILFKHYIESSINKSRVPPSPSDIIEQPIDNGYEYHDTFASLDVFEEIAVKDKKLAWMFPTTYAFAVADEAEIPADPKNSVLSICCMVKGRKNMGSGMTDINAIPDGSDTAILISQEIVTDDLIYPSIINAFDKDKGSVSKDDFEKDGLYTIVNKNELKLSSIGYKNSNGDPVSAEVKPGHFTCSVNQDNVLFKVEKAEVVYDANNDLKSLISKTERATFGVNLGNESNDTRSFYTKVTEKRTNIEPVLPPDKFNFLYLVYLMLIEVFVATLVAALFACKRGTRNENIPRDNQVLPRRQVRRELEDNQDFMAMMQEEAALENEVELQEINNNPRRVEQEVVNREEIQNQNRMTYGETFKSIYCTRDFAIGTGIGMLLTIASYIIAVIESKSTEKTKENIKKGGDNLSGNTLKTVVHNLFNKITWPQAPHTDLINFELVNSMRISMKYENNYKGYISEENPKQISPFINSELLESVTVKNIGKHNLNFYSVQYEEDLMEVPNKVGNTIVISAGSSESINADQLPPLEKNMMWVLDVDDNDTTFELIIKNKNND